MKYLFNPTTDSFEPLEPTLRDRFALGGRVSFKEAGIVKPYSVSQELVDKVDLDELKRLRSQGFTTEQIANKFKVNVGSLEAIISANKLPKPVVIKSKKRLKALNQVIPTIHPC